jgi:hypothetical protein
MPEEVSIIEPKGLASKILSEVEEAMDLSQDRLILEQKCT